MKLRDIFNMEEYLKNECYCPGEIYSVDGFFYQIFRAETECELIGRCEIKDNYLCKIPFMSVISKSTDNVVQILFIMYQDNKIKDILIFDATENNIRLIKEVIKNNSTSLKFNEYEEGRTEKSLKKIFEIADAIMID